MLGLPSWDIERVGLCHSDLVLLKKLLSESNEIQKQYLQISINQKEITPIPKNKNGGKEGTNM